MEGINIHPEVSELFEELVSIRRQIHMNPELLYDLPLTTKLVKDYLTGLDLEVIPNVGISGVVGIIKNPGPCIMLRADMDCLPLQEENEVPYKSKIPGRMHACGHDTHVAMLLIAAKVLAKRKNSLKGSVKFVFQPAEEGGNGALKMVEDEVYPVLDAEPKVDQVYGIHVMNLKNIGNYLLPDKYMSSYCDFFTIIIKGKGGHIASQFNNPVVIAAELILALQTILSRNITDKERAVLSVTSFTAGEAENAVSDTCRVLGTTRAFDKEIREILFTRIKEICKGFEVSNNCQVELQITELLGPITNDSQCNEIALRVLKKISPTGTRDIISPMIGEDFSCFSDRVPGTFFGLDCATEGKNNSIHSTEFDIDERAMLIGSSFFVELVLDLLG